MAQDINEQVSNMFTAANAKHALYSGLPAATQMAYDRETFLPGTASMAQKALAKQKENQDAWDEYMEYMDKLNEQANYYNGLANEIKSKYAQYGSYAGSQDK